MKSLHVRLLVNDFDAIFEFYTRDPEGSLIELHTPLAKEKWSDGLKEAADKYEK